MRTRGIQKRKIQIPGKLHNAGRKYTRKTMAECCRENFQKEISLVDYTRVEKSYELVMLK